MRNHLDAFLNRLPFPNERYYEVVAVLVVGLGGGGLVLVFKALIRWFHAVLFGDMGGWLSQWGLWTVIAVPVVGGVLVGLLRQFFVKSERHHGVAGIMEAVALAGGRLRYYRTPLKGPDLRPVYWRRRIGRSRRPQRANRCQPGVFCSAQTAHVRRAHAYFRGHGRGFGDRGSFQCAHRGSFLRCGIDSA